MARSKTVLLSGRDESSRRFVCDGSVVPPRLGILKSQTRTSTFYGKAKAGPAKKRATIECKRKISRRICGDGLDNDADGIIDFPGDVDCHSSLGASEGPPAAVPTSSATALPVPTGIPSLALFRSPFNSDFAVSNFFDHDVPEEFIDRNGFSRIATGETLTDNLDGHQGYDFELPEGTIIVATGDGEIDGAGLETAFFCPLLDKTVSGNFVRIRHKTENALYYSLYLHLSRVDVTVGQIVTAGTVLGLSGNTGCSTGPHLHFDIRRHSSDDRMVSVDPFGWSGTDIDPWTLDSKGLPSIYLWKAGQAPAMYREARLAPNPNAGNSAVAIIAIRTMGFGDSTNPNNEFIELQTDPRFVRAYPVSLDGYYLLNNKGDRYDFPNGTTLDANQTLTLRVGSGDPAPNTLYWNQARGVLDNNGDCARLFRKDGFRVYYLFYGDKGCTGISSKKSSTRAQFSVKDMVGPSFKNPPK